jgi:methionine-rich copper-binding protein CopC
LPAATIAVIRQWITDGALPPPPAAAETFTLDAITPAPLEILAAAPARIVMAFNGELDQNRLAAGSVLLERIEAGATQAGGSQVVATQLRVPAGNPRALMLEPLAPLAPGHYRVRMPSPASNGLAGISGAGLDATPTSGDATTLTDFEITSTP